MEETATATRVRLAIDDKSFELSPEVDLSELRKAIENASKTDGTFVDFEVVGGGQVSALIGAPCSIYISIDPTLTARAHEEPAHVFGEFDL